MMRAKVPVWTWRDAIRRAKVAAYTKLVCYSLANYLADAGEGCFPSVETLIEDTGLSNRSIATHLQNAVAAALITITREKGEDGRFKRTVYHPRFPADCELPRYPAHHLMGPRNTGRARVDGGSRRMNEVHAVRPGEGASGAPREGSSRRARRVKEGHPAKPDEGASRGPREPGGDDRMKDVHGEQSIRELSTPPPPIEESAHVGEKIALIEQLREEGQPPHVLDCFLAKLMRGGLRPWRDVPDPMGPARQLCADFRHHQIAVLEAAADQLLNVHKHRLPPVPDCRKAVVEAEAAADRRAAEYRARAAWAPPADAAVAARGSEVLERLRSALGPHVVASWFRDLQLERCLGRCLTVSVPQRFHRTWITTHYEADLLAAGAAVFGEIAQVEVVLRGQAGTGSGRAVRAAGRGVCAPPQTSGGGA